MCISLSVFVQQLLKNCQVVKTLLTQNLKYTLSSLILNNCLGRIFYSSELRVTLNKATNCENKLFLPEYVNTVKSIVGPYKQRQVNMPVEEKISLSAIPQYYLPIETNTLQFDGTNNGNK